MDKDETNYFFLGQTYLEYDQSDGKEEAGESPPPLPFLLNPLAFKTVQLGSWQEHQQQRQAEKKKELH